MVWEMERKGTNVQLKRNKFWVSKSRMVNIMNNTILKVDLILEILTQFNIKYLKITERRP